MGLLPHWVGTWFWIAEQVLKLALAMRILLRRDGRPESNVAWLAVVFAEPLVGLFFYALIGERHLGRRRVRRYREAAQPLPSPRECVPAGPEDSEAAARPPGLESARDPLPAEAPEPEIVRLVEALGGTRPVSGNRLELFSNSEDFAGRLIGDIERAERTCNLLFYIWLDDETGRAVAAALERAAERGVDCRVSLDSLGSNDTLKGDLVRTMRERGVQVIEGLPAGPLRALFERVDLRNHRKLVVIDGHIGYTGSQNLAHSSFARKPKYAPWFDVMLRMEGPGARLLQRVFLGDWYAETGQDLGSLLERLPAQHSDGALLQVLASGPETEVLEMQQLTQGLAHHASEQLTMTTPYFVPDPADSGSLRTAARRGVRVRLIVPARSDSKLANLAARGHFSNLMRAGVEVYLFQPGMLHAKTFTVDDALAVITTANFDKRSFDLNFECSTLVLDASFTTRLRLLQEDYIRSSKRLDPETWRARPWPRRLLENAAGLLSPLL